MRPAIIEKLERTTNPAITRRPPTTRIPRTGTCNTPLIMQERQPSSTQNSTARSQRPQVNKQQQAAQPRPIVSRPKPSLSDHLDEPQNSPRYFQRRLAESDGTAWP